MKCCDLFPTLSFSFPSGTKVRAAEAKIRERYPEAAFIELEPDSSTHASYALEHYKTPALRQVGLRKTRGALGCRIPA